MGNESASPGETLFKGLWKDRAKAAREQLSQTDPALLPALVKTLHEEGVQIPAAPKAILFLLVRAVGMEVGLGILAVIVFALFTLVVRIAAVVLAIPMAIVAWIALVILALILGCFLLIVGLVSTSLRKYIDRTVSAMLPSGDHFWAFLTASYWKISEFIKYGVPALLALGLGTYFISELSKYVRLRIEDQKQARLFVAGLIAGLAILGLVFAAALHSDGEDWAKAISGAAIFLGVTAWVAVDAVANYDSFNVFSKFAGSLDKTGAAASNAASANGETSAPTEGQSLLSGLAHDAEGLYRILFMKHALRLVLLTTQECRAETATALCQKCLTRMEDHVDPVLRVQYPRCRTCGRLYDTTDVFSGVRSVVAVLASHWSEPFQQKEDELYVNWHCVEKQFDFDRVDVMEATDEDLERLLMQAKNDLDDTRRDRYPSIPLRVGPRCELSGHTRNMLVNSFPRTQFMSTESNPGLQDNG